MLHAPWRRVTPGVGIATLATMSKDPALLMPDQALSPPRRRSREVEADDPVRARLLEIMELGDRAERGEVVVTSLEGLSGEEVERVLFGRMPTG